MGYSYLNRKYTYEASTVKTAPQKSLPHLKPTDSGSTEFGIVEIGHGESHAFVSSVVCVERCLYCVVVFFFFQKRDEEHRKTLKNYLHFTTFFSSLGGLGGGAKVAEDEGLAREKLGCVTGEGKGCRRKCRR